MYILFKLLFLFHRPKVIIVAGKSSDLAIEAIFSILRYHKISVRKLNKLNFSVFSFPSVFIFELLPNDEKTLKEAMFLVSKSLLSIVVITHIGESTPDGDLFSGSPEDVKNIAKFIEKLPASSRLFLNFDDEIVRDLKNKTDVSTQAFGFQEGANLRATDIIFTREPALSTNFKINYQGKIVPIWLNYLFGKEHIYTALAATVVGIMFDLNLVEISEGLARYKGLPGRMRLVQGIKNSQILDDSASASVWSMAESLEILGKIEAKRKIAVLGDVLKAGKYAVEAHESLGGRIKRVGIDLLFTVGPRAKFIAEGAKNKGFLENNIFSFDNVEAAINVLKEKIQERDLILVDGSTEMKMEEIVSAIKSP